MRYKSLLIADKPKILNQFWEAFFVHGFYAIIYVLFFHRSVCIIVKNGKNGLKDRTI